MLMEIRYGHQVVPAVINAKGRLQQLRQVVAPEHIAVIEKNDIPETKRCDRLPDLRGKFAVVTPVQQAEKGGIRHPVDGRQDTGRIEVPDTVSDRDDVLPALQYLQPPDHGRLLSLPDTGDLIDGSIYIQYPVIFGQLDGDVLAIAA